MYVFFVHTYEEAEEITQETYSKVMAYLKKEYAVIENYSAYLKTIALNIIRDEWRKQNREPARAIKNMLHL
ncbi:RNA polymerase sigma factor [Anaerocolumna jejuensis]|uniref:RNA polymerase sigma factor n=1 Tax=Anaerocolumna jejuensis TaxID=259063 RepID=UPI00093378B2|nr:sigma factor [Anaerocolumna jejuensis]